MPSLTSIFPFLEAIRPERHPTWHISRAQALDHYIPAWVSHAGGMNESEEMSLITFDGEKFCDTDKLSTGLSFFLILIPQSWDKKAIVGKLLGACTGVGSLGKPGIVITKAEFDKTQHL
jgi:hypothetical protein